MLRKIAMVGLLSLCTGAGLWAAAQGEAAGAAGTEPKPVLKFISNYVSFEPGKDPTVEVIQRLTGYQFEYFTLPADNPLQKIVLELSSGVNYDVIKMDKGMYDNLIGKNVFTPLDDLINANAPNIKKLLDPKMDYWQTSIYQGKVLSIPGEQPRSDNGNGLAVNSALLQQIGLPVPKTLDEFYAMLKTIKEKQKIIPVTGSGWNSPIISSAFNVVNITFTVEDGKLIPGVKQKGMKAYLSYMAKLYKEGLIDAEWPINKAAIVQEKFVTGKAAMRLMGWWELPGPHDALQKSFPGAQIKFVLPLVGPNGEQAIDIPRRPENFTAVPRTSQNPAHAVKMLNSLYQLDNLMEVVLGVKGVHYEIRSDGEYWPIQPQFMNEKTNSHWYYSPIPGLGFSKMWQARVKKNDILYQAFLDLDKVPAGIKKFDPTNFASSLPMVAKYRQSCDQVFADWAIKVIAGAEDISTYDSIIKEWEKSGGAEMEKEASAWYASQK